MLRISIPGAITLGMIVAVLGWLIVKPGTNLPIGASVPSPQPKADRLLAEGYSLEAIQATIAGLLKRLEVLEAEKTADQPAASPVPAVVVSKTAAPAFAIQVIYLGAGSTTQRDWTETGAQAWLDSNSYPAGVNVVFEAGLSIIGGEAWARLKNKTTGAIISVSEVFHNNSSVTWKSSPQFKLHPGNNLYVVELKSSSDEVANLAGSRVQLSQ